MFDRTEKLLSVAAIHGYKVLILYQIRVWDPRYVLVGAGRLCLYRCGFNRRVQSGISYPDLVLGAWGCGVFKNNPEDVARYFYHHLAENPQLNGFFDRVAFAILDNSKNRAIIKPFQAIFDPR